MSGTVTLKTRGVGQIRSFISSAQNIPKDAFPLIVNDLRDIGVAAGKASIKSSVGVNSTGNLEHSFQGLVRTINTEHRQVEIGSDLDDHYGNAVAKFVSEGTSRRYQGGNVQVAPTPLRYGYLASGIWKFITIHPGTKPHPFMENTAESIENNLNPVISKYLRQGWSKAENEGKGAPPEP